MSTPLLALVAKVLFLPMLVFAAASLVKGYSSPGGGFAAGAIAGVAVLLQRIVFGRDVANDILGLRARKLALVAGVGLALGVALLPMVAGRPFLAHAPGPGGDLLHFGRLELHTSLLFDAGVGLLVLAFALEAVRLVAPVEEDRSGQEEEEKAQEEKEKEGEEDR